MRAWVTVMIAGALGTVGCVEAADPLPAGALPPPVFQLDGPAEAGVGGSLVLDVSGTLGEDERVWFLLGSQGLGAGPCFSEIGGACVGVLGPIVVGSRLVDDAGNAQMVVNVPSSVPTGRTYAVQAAVIRGLNGRESVLSNPIPFTTVHEARFTYTGAPETFTVPARVTSIEVEACGAQGGDGWNLDVSEARGVGGRGGRVWADLAVTPGEVLEVRVGGQGGDGGHGAPGLGGYNGGGNGSERLGYSGGGGGGASDIRRGSTLASRVVVAGGGGAGSGWCTNGSGSGGDGGGTVAGDGQQCVAILVGTGGGQTAGGSFGGVLGLGGSATTTAGAGGGGGYYGGGASDGSGGGGGSSYATALSRPTHAMGDCDGDGSVRLRW